MNCFIIIIKQLSQKLPADKVMKAVEEVEENVESLEEWEIQSDRFQRQQSFIQINPPSEISGINIFESPILSKEDYFQAPQDLELENIFFQNENETVPMTSIQEDYSTIGQSSLGHDATTQKSTNIKSTNSLKNFIMNFVKYISSEESGAKIIFMSIQEIKPDLKKFKKLLECLKKKIKKDKHTIEHLRSLLVYKDQHYTKFILDICEQFLDKYPQIVKKSTRMGNDNLSIIPTVSNLLKFQRDSILYVNYNKEQTN